MAILADRAGGWIDVARRSFDYLRRGGVLHPHVVALKLATPRTDAMEFEDVVANFPQRLAIIDDNLMFPLSHALCASAFEMHLSNYCRGGAFALSPISIAARTRRCNGRW